MLSVDTIKAEVDREGAPWGIHGAIRGDKVYAAEFIPRAVSHGHGLGHVEDEECLISSVDEDHPFSWVLRNRIQRHEWDLMARVRAHEERQKRAEVEKAYEMEQVMRDKLRRIVFQRRSRSVPIGYGVIRAGG